MCANMKEFQTISEKIFELEQKKAKKKNELTVAGLTVLFTAYVRPTFDKDAFIAGEEDGEATYNKYLRDIPMERVTVRLAKAQL